MTTFDNDLHRILFLTGATLADAERIYASELIVKALKQIGLFSRVTISETQPGDTTKLWLDKSTVPDTLRYYTGSAWAEVTDSIQAMRVLYPYSEEELYLAEVAEVDARVDDVLERQAARPTYADDATFLLGVEDGGYGYVGTTLKKRVGASAVSQTADEMKSLKQAIADLGSVDADPTLQAAVRLTNISGSGAAYSADSVVSGDAANGAFFVFRPHVTNTASNPTLSINGGTARILATASGQVLPGMLVADSYYLLTRVDSAYRLFIGSEANVIRLESFTSADGLAYTASVTGAPLVAQGTIVEIVPVVTNTGNVTVSINGGSAIQVLSSDLKAIPAGRLKRQNYYIGWYLSIAVVLFNIDTIDPQVQHGGDAAEIMCREAMRERTLYSAGNDSQPIYVVGSPGSFSRWVCSEGDNGRMIYVGGTDVDIDLQLVKSGSTVPNMIYVASGSSAKLRQRPGLATLTAGANTLVQIYRPADSVYLCTALQGSLTSATYASDPLPARDYSIITAGQSLARGWMLGGGWHGLQLGFQSLDYQPTVFPIQGATGGSGLTVESNATAYWWIPETSMPGPSALDWKAALNARPAGQPAPSVIYWCFGQTDAAKMGEHSHFSIANYATSLRELFAWMRAEVEADGGDEDCAIVISPLGSQDAPFPYPEQYSAVRWVELALIAEDANIYLGPTLYDLPRRYYDSHPTLEGQKLQGYRLAKILQNIWDGDTPDQNIGPTVTEIEELDAGARYRLHIEQSRDSVPFTKFDDSYGFAAFASGEDPLSADPLLIRSKVWALDGLNWVYDLYLDQASPGAVIMYPWGGFKEVSTGKYIRDVVYDSQMNFPPLCEFVASAGDPPVAPTV